jgi:hypothetical protein
MYVTALYFPVCCHGPYREYPKIYEINSVLLQMCVNLNGSGGIPVLYLEDLSPLLYTLQLPSTIQVR